MPDGTSDLRHIGVSPERLATLAGRHGDVFAQLVPTRFAGAVSDELLERMQVVASDVLTDQQLRVWVLWLAGQGPTEMAVALGISHQRVGQLLHGDHPRRSNHGVVSKMTDALKKDSSFMKQAARALDGSPEDEERTLLTWWMASIGRPELFVPLTVLLLAHRAADAKRQVRLDYLLTLMPRVALEHGLHTLRGRGFVAYDGVTVEIRRTPLDKEAA